MKNEIMIRNYLIVAFRNIIRSKASTIINLLGLAFGIGVFVLIALYVYQEYRVDRFIVDKERIYRVEAGEWALLGPGFADKIKEVAPEVEEAISIRPYFFDNEIVNVDDRLLPMHKYFPVTNSAIDFFGFKILSGTFTNPLQDPYDIVLTQSEAKRLFGKDNPIGKTITLFDKYTLTVKAVMEDPRQFHLQFNALISYEILPIIFGWDDMGSMLFNNMNNPTYIKLVSSNHREVVIERLTSHLVELYGSSLPFAINLRPVSDVYFKGTIAFEGDVKHGNLRFIGVMVVVAFLILFLASVNYINLSTAKASSRAKEIGIRKAVGGKKSSIIFQFLGESVLITLFALVIGLAIVELMAPFFGNLVERDLSTSSLFSFRYILLILLGTVFLGVISGLYPSVYLGSYNPSRVLKGDVSKGTRGGNFRKTLIVFQFSVSVALIISTLVIFSQLDYFTSYDVGFNKEQIINVKIPRKVAYGYDAFKEKVNQIPAVKGISRSNSTFGQIGWQESFRDDNGDIHNYSYMPIDPDFIDLLELELIEGRNFEWERSTDVREAIIVNETMAKMIDLENPLGKNLKGGFVETTIIGVVKDFNFNSLHSNIGPLGLHFRGRDYNTYNIKIDTEHLSQTLSQLNGIWEEYALEAPFDYGFLNETFENTYRSEKRMGQMFGYFAVIAILIGCMGLYGLSAFMLQARVKEMGIRKVLGASTIKIIGLMAKEFALLVIISNAIAWPVAYYAMNSWLQGFPYKISMNLLFFVTALTISLGIAFITVSYHSWRTARANPVDSLKYE